MQKLAEVTLWTVLPMAAVWSVYSLADRRAGITRRLTKLMPALRTHKAAFQLALPAGFILAFGAVCLLSGLPDQVYFAVCGSLTGLINGIAAAIMHGEDI